MSANLVRVLVVEDSPVVRQLLVQVLENDPCVRVVGTAANGLEALAAVERVRPDVLTMDIHMPRLDGLAATRRIMQHHPVPIVIVSGVVVDDIGATFDALSAGALAFVPCPPGPGHPRHEAGAAELVRTVRLMSEVRVVRRTPAREATREEAEPPVRGGKVRVVAIGASTGGPQALLQILAALPHPYPIPIAIVQHMAPGFIGAMVQWLNRVVRVKVILATHGATARPGHAYMAPDGYQMGISRQGQITLHDAPGENGLRPSVSHLFRSVLESFGGAAGVVLLSGMGNDGAAELVALRSLGAFTLVQDCGSSVVYGMAEAAVRLDACVRTAPPEEIALALSGLSLPRTSP